MAFVQDLNRFETGLIRRMRATFEDSRRAFNQRRKYNETYNELSRLSARELSDIGISRDQIASIARSAADQG